MNKIRALLEEIKQLDEVRREAEGDPPEDAMKLYPPASQDAIQKLLNGGWSHPVPPSFGDFLSASNGVAKFRGKLDFLSTESTRQEPIRSTVRKKIQQDYINLRALFKTVDNAAIAKWESDPKRFYVANHPVIAVTEMGGLLFYDSRTRNAAGEMDLCWRSATQAVIEKRYDNIEKYLEAALQEAREEAGVK
jgi:hypothetical protein